MLSQQAMIAQNLSEEDNEFQETNIITQGEISWSPVEGDINLIFFNNQKYWVVLIIPPKS